MKKKCTRDELREGTSANPLRLNDWTDAQLHNYYSACGIEIADSYAHKLECLDYIRMLEKTKSIPSRGSAETS